jgi:hypothetical protein
MTNRQRFKTFLVTSALIGGLCLPAMAGELTPAQTAPDTTAPAAQPAPVGQSAPAPQASQPATEAPKGAKVTPAAPHRIAHVTPRVFQPGPAPREVRIASSEPVAIASAAVSSRALMMWGIAY